MIGAFPSMKAGLATAALAALFVAGPLTGRTAEDDGVSESGLAGSLCTSSVTATAPRNYLRDAGALAAKLSQLAAVGVSTASPADPNAYVEPPVFASAGGVLDIMMIAKPKRISTIAYTPLGGATLNPIGWVFEVCPRPATGLDCPANSSTVSDYGGVRLALQPGDKLKVRFVNRLPALDPVKVNHSSDPGGANLSLNPTNLHTHGLIVPARVATANDPTYGDYVFVDVFNSANGPPAAMKVHAHSLVAMDYVDYRIDIPFNHPSGAFWFHPHVHGLALNQVSSGMAGIITIGNSSSYLANAPQQAPKHLILKDLQVLAAGTIDFDNGPAAVANGEVLHQQDPAFCEPDMREIIRRGTCYGEDNRREGGNNYSGGVWYFTINGRVYPTIPVASPNGDIWRLTNASGNLSYKLKLGDDATGQDMAFQIVAIDGVSVALPQDGSAASVVKLAGAKFNVVSCGPASSQIQPPPVCTNELVMMPSSRAEIWVAHRDGWGNVDIPPAGATATLRMAGLQMGTGEGWPALNLASVVFGTAQTLRKPPAALAVHGDAARIVKTGGVFAARAAAAPAPLPAGCKALPAGNRRRIFFGLADLSDGGSFGLGYEEVDSRGNPVPGTQVPVSRFDPDNPTICLPRSAWQQAVHETWELVQLSTENHNFHIHQTKFRVIDQPSAPTSSFGAASTAVGIVEDNLPLGVVTPDASILDLVMNQQNGVCSIDQWRSGKCASKTVYVDIPFSQLGDFVYHCHILEHEDSGMMAKIRVVSSP